KDPVPETINAKSGEETVVCETPWGKYSAVVFKGAGNYEHRMDRLDYSDKMYFGYGEMLARLHLLSKEFTSETIRPDWRENLFRAANILKEYNAPVSALKEAVRLEEFFANLPVTNDNYGLVHYDFELDNIFYNPETSNFGVIDFDDSMYHWYAMDIKQSLDSIREELPDEYRPQAVNQFLNGYYSVTNPDEAITAHMPVFKRYADLCGYARCLHSLHEKWTNEPEWMIKLRKHIENLMKKMSENFGEPIKAVM
ncbi:MAG: phosphotransferase, partial [Clostridiales bacterium]|nr:phosphotransferase [Clostridiales bacterium]